VWVGGGGGGRGASEPALGAFATAGPLTHVFPPNSAQAPAPGAKPEREEWELPFYFTAAGVTLLCLAAMVSKKPTPHEWARDEVEERERRCAGRGACPGGRVFFARTFCTLPSLPPFFLSTTTTLPHPQALSGQGGCARR
jgi:hypothetical protein